jgi:predicted transcriptional regulator
MPYNKAKEIEVISMKPTSIRLSDSLYEKVKNDADKEKRSITV